MIFVTPHPAEKLQYFFGVFLQFQIGVDKRREAALRKFIKDCERLYEKNRAHLQEDADHE